MIQSELWYTFRKAVAGVPGHSDGIVEASGEPETGRDGENTLPQRETWSDRMHGGGTGYLASQDGLRRDVDSATARPDRSPDAVR